MKYHPNLVPMHLSRQYDFCVVNTGGMFGDNTNPSNFDPLGLGRQQLAQYLWAAAVNAVAIIVPYLPPLNLATAPTAEDIANVQAADCDTTNDGVMQADGTRKPPPYNVHVDDALYADVGQHIFHSICVSILALFWLLGFPTNPLVPSPLSVDKFESFYNHQWKMVGRRFNSRALSVGLLDYKLDHHRDGWLCLPSSSWESQPYLVSWRTIPDMHGGSDVGFSLSRMLYYADYPPWSVQNCLARF